MKFCTGTVRSIASAISPTWNDAEASIPSFSAVQKRFRTRFRKRNAFELSQTKEAAVLTLQISDLLSQIHLVVDGEVVE